MVYVKIQVVGHFGGLTAQIVHLDRRPRQHGGKTALFLADEMYII